jgi:CDP-6-deoxy-D-xylo-4-hexulose-3-dehydrase
MFYELAASTWGPEEQEAIQRVLASGQLTMGPEVRRFEAQFAAYFGVPHAVMCNSGSSANLIGVAALCYKRDRPLQRGDEVLVPPISWVTTYTPLQQYGLTLRFVDVERDSLNLDVDQLEAALTPRTRAVAAISILGNPARLDEVRQFADRHGLYFYEDNCESMDAELGGRKTGTFGDFGTFSFFFSHHISTIEGGMLITRDPELAELARCIRAHGWTRDLPQDTSLFERGTDAFYEAYRFILPGYNVRPMEISGAVGQEQLKKLPSMTEARRANWHYFKQRFAGDDRFITQREHGKSSTFSFTIILNPEHGLDRNRVFAALREADIGFRMITGGNFLRHDAIRHFDHSCHGSMANADLAHDAGFFVGNHPFDLTPQIDRLHDVLDRACSRRNTP